MGEERLEQKVIFASLVSIVESQVYFIYPAKSYFFMAIIFYLLKNYNPSLRMISVVIDVYKFGQEIFKIGIFWKFL